MKYFLIVSLTLICLAPMPKKHKKQKREKESVHCGFCMGVIHGKDCLFCGCSESTVFQEVRDVCEPD